MIWEILKAVVIVVVIGIFLFTGIGFIAYYSYKFFFKALYYFKYRLLKIDINKDLKEVLEDVYDSIDKDNVRREDIEYELYLKSSDPKEKRIYNTRQVQKIKNYLDWYGKPTFFSKIKDKFKKDKNDGKK